MNTFPLVLNMKFIFYKRHFRLTAIVGKKNERISVLTCSFRQIFSPS